MYIYIELSVLQAALIIAPKKDVRYYLNGVYIEQNKLAVTDGHRLFAYDLDNENNENKEFKPFIIPRDSLENFIRGIAPKERKSAIIDISVIDGEHRLNYQESSIVFMKIDGRYPDYQKVIPAEYETSPHLSYDWGYMNDFKKIAILLGDKYGACKLKPNGKNTATVEIVNDKKATCVIMPMRDKSNEV